MKFVYVVWLINFRFKVCSKSVQLTSQSVNCQNKNQFYPYEIQYVWIELIVGKLQTICRLLWHGKNEVAFELFGRFIFIFYKLEVF